MKPPSFFTAILAIWLTGISVYLVTQARQGETTAVGAKLGGDEAARLRSRLDAAEKRIAALQSDLRSRPADMGPVATDPGPSATATQEATPVAAASGSTNQPSATFTVNGTTITVTGNLPGLLASSAPFDPAVVADFDANAFFSSQGPATYPELAKAGVKVLLTARDNPDYLNTHPAMDAVLQTVANLSGGLIKDDGTNPEATAQSHRAFSAALDSSITRAKTIAARANESPASVQQTQQIQQMLEVMKSREGQ